MTWSPGDAVVLREVWREEVWAARPAIVVRDGDDVTMFHVPPGIRFKQAATPDGEALALPGDGWVLADRIRPRTRILSFAWPAVAHAVLMRWNADTGEFRGWYVNLQTPLRPTALGFDYVDHVLDVVVAPDRSWRWKDQGELEEAVGRGLFSPEEAGEIRAEAGRVVERIRAGAPPFDGSWLDWEPDPAWPVPELPPGWDLLD